MELDIRIAEIDPLKALRTSLRLRLRFALGRFAPSIRHVRVRLTGTKGPSRPLEAKCQIDKCRGKAEYDREQCLLLQFCTDLGTDPLGSFNGVRVSAQVLIEGTSDTARYCIGAGFACV